MTRSDDAPRAEVVLCGGLGSPHDDFFAATIRALGTPATTLGALDADALDRGRRAAGRGHCAPALYTTGALLRAAEARRGAGPISYLSLSSCGPCRFALFTDTWSRALAREGHRDAELLPLAQDGGALLERLQFPIAWRLLDGILAADALCEGRRRVAPHVVDHAELDRRFDEAVAAVARLLETGADAAIALGAVSEWHCGMTRAPERAHPRIAIIGDPWSMHVEGDGQMHLPKLLARAGAHAELQPVALWLAYLLWQARSSPWGLAPAPSDGMIARVRAIEERLRTRLAELANAAGLASIDLADVDELAELAAPYLPASFRGGYGHVEVGLAARAVRDRRVHLIVSVKSFGCIPSAGVSDAIIPSALEGAIPFLVLEVSGDGDAARESRLALHLAAAQERALAQVGS